jgi:electron transport complex protein RnfA
MGTLYLYFTQDLFLRGDYGSAEFLGFQLYFSDHLGVLGAALFGLQTGLGFLLASLMLLAVRHRLYSQKVPAAFRGYPAVLLYIGLISMAVHAIAA